MTDGGAVQISDGVWAQPITMAVLPAHLDQHLGRVATCRCTPLLLALQVTRQSRPQVLGVRRDCIDDVHERVHWLSGYWEGRDLPAEPAHGQDQVAVRDVSYDILIDATPDGRTLRMTPKGKARRRDALLGLYTGQRPAGRVYR